MLDYAINHEFDDIVLLQATSPLTISNNINEALKIYFESSATSLISIVKTHQFLWELKGGFIVPTNYDNKKRPRRQDWIGQLVENGAIYTTSRRSLIESKSYNIPIYKYHS